jgi:formamidopyrimidine-DNA glycosylase
MPELPDVEGFRRHAAATSLHKQIVQVRVSEARMLEEISPQSLGRKLNGRQFERTLRHGKYLLLDTGDGYLVLHFGMSGSLQMVSGSKLPQYTRVEFHFAGDGCLAYLSRRLLGHIFLVQDRGELVEKKQLGPDALAVDAERFCERFAEKKGSLKTALMDQSLIAGIGNVYSDEILFQLPAHPRTDVHSLDGKDLRKLYNTCQRVLKTTIRHHANPDEMPSGYLLPRRNTNGHCPRCDTPLKKIKVGGRTAVICPRCQRKGETSKKSQ